jgi:phosphoadenosine phosphosulfate reductase
MPILFLETEKHFPETLEYVEKLKQTLGLKDVRLLYPDRQLLQNIDPDGSLWSSQPNRCCWLRKVEPLQRALNEYRFTALITGRKRYQTQQRATMETIELHDDGRFRINPLATWSKERINEEFKRRGLPEHPLVAKGYLSIGCAPCTRIVKPGEDERAGRWSHTSGLPGGEQKSECGIHIAGKDIHVDSVPKTPDWSV